MKRTALITGAASGIGFEFSLLLARDSYDLILVDIDSKKLAITESYIRKMFNCKTTLLVRDLSRLNISEEIFEEVKEKEVDVLINNAGFGLYGEFSKTNWLKESEMLNLHIYTTTHLTKLILNQMIERDNGRILNVASLAGFLPGPLMSLYYASKAYIISFSQAVANELSGTGVTLTVLCPGQTKTAFRETVSKDSIDAKINFNMASPKKVAQYGYAAMLKGKKVAIPGKLNRFTSFLTRVVPRNTGTAVVRKLQEKNRTKLKKEKNYFN